MKGIASSDLLFASVVVLAGCAATVDRVDGGAVDGGNVDVAAVTDTPSMEAGTDASGCGPRPGAGCFQGSSGTACSDVGMEYECFGGRWQCPSGSTDQCGCEAGPQPGGLPPLEPGAACPSVRDSGMVDVGSDVGCAGGMTTCNSACVDLQTDPSNCGICSGRCCPGNDCAAGTCEPGCSPGLTACPGSLSSCMGGVCVNIATDNSNCGMCGYACPTGRVCARGMCVNPG